MNHGGPGALACGIGRSPTLDGGIQDASALAHRDFQKHVLLAPKTRNLQQPILATQQMPGPGPFSLGKDMGPSGRLGSRHAAHESARLQANSRFVPDLRKAFGIAANHHINLTAIAGEPKQPRCRFVGLTLRGQPNTRWPFQLWRNATSSFRREAHRLGFAQKGVRLVILRVLGRARNCPKVYAWVT